MNQFLQHYLLCKRAAEEATKEPAPPAPIVPPILPKPSPSPLLKPAYKFFNGDPLARPRLIARNTPKMPPSVGPIERG